MDNMYVPAKCTGIKERFNCAIEDLDQIYNFTIYPDFANKAITMICGYNDTGDYDSYFSGSVDNMRKLANDINKIADIYEKEMSKLDKAGEFISDMIKSIESNNVKELNIDVKNIYTKNTNDPLFGCIIMDIDYCNLNNTSYSCTLLSDNIINNDIISKLDRLDDNIKVVFNKDKYNDLLSELKEVNYAYHKNNGSLKELEKEDLDQMVQNVLHKIDEDTKK